MAESRKLFLLDGMALVYRAHFALIRSPIRTSKGKNVSAVYGFVTTVLELLEKQQPTYLALVFDTPAATFRHERYPAYKAQREAMPEELVEALPVVRRFAAALRIPVLAVDGWEADDVIGTLARRAEEQGGIETYMVTPDKDFAQLVSGTTRIYKPGRQGAAAEILGPEEVCAQWEVSDPRQVAEVLGLWGDASDNIPGVPGVGEKTAKKLIAEYGSIEQVLSHAGGMKGKLRESLETHAEQARLCRELATIAVDAPVEVRWDELRVGDPDRAALAPLLVELEFNALGRRLLGDGFVAGRGHEVAARGDDGMLADASGQGLMFGGEVGVRMRRLDRAAVRYRLVDDLVRVEELAGRLGAAGRICFDTETTSLDPLTAELVGISFAMDAGEAWYVAVPDDAAGRAAVLASLRPVFAGQAEKIGQNLKYDLAVLAAQGVEVAGPYFDTMLAHSLTNPEQRHTMDAMAEAMLGYTPVPISSLLGGSGSGQRTMRQAYAEDPVAVAEYACEDADITLQLAEKLAPELVAQGMDGVFRAIEMPLLPVLVAMETEGIRIDALRLQRIGRELQDLAAGLQDKVLAAAGVDFNLNSPRQLGEVLFGHMKLAEKPKKTKTGQYVTNEQVLAELAGRHPIVQHILDYREATKLKSTYVDSLPNYVHARSGRVHTHFHQLVAATGRMASSDPNLQNIPIRTELGRGIRDAFVARDDGHVLLSADYSQIELRVMAALSGDAGMIEAFAGGVDIHTATAARVYGVAVDAVDAEMRRRAKMVNFGIIYGISAFGLAQRLGIPRSEADSIINAYFARYPGVKTFMDRVVADARRCGYVETLTGRRRVVRDLNSANQNIRQAAERIAINTPIQGTAADMIKLAMVRVHRALREAAPGARLLLQVHDELVFDVPVDEVDRVRGLVVEAMTQALPLPGVPVTVEIGAGRTWLEAH